MSDLKQTLADYEKARTEIVKTVQGQLPSAAKELFDKYPDMKSFGWQQGLYYNDEGDEYEVHNDEYSVYINGERHQGTDEQRKKVAHFLGQIEESIFKQVFGEEAKVTVTREGVTVEENDGDY